MCSNEALLSNGCVHTAYVHIYALESGVAILSVLGFREGMETVWAGIGVHHQESGKINCNPNLAALFHYFKVLFSKTLLTSGSQVGLFMAKRPSSDHRLINLIICHYLFFVQYSNTYWSLSLLMICMNVDFKPDAIRKYCCTLTYLLFFSFLCLALLYFFVFLPCFSLLL